jgi:two-component system, response regulator, stage 0 sporulation protein F
MGDMRERRLLIVDDEPQVRDMLQTYFAEAGYTVATAPDVPAALAKLPDGFDAVLSDIKMPGASGIDFLQDARRRNPKLGVFLITGHPSLETINEAKQHGATAYFRKPLQLVEVDSRLRTFFGEDARSLIEGHVLIVGLALQETLVARLARFQTAACEEHEPGFLEAVQAHRPKVVLAAAASPGIPALLRAYRSLGRGANCFIVLSDETTLDAANEMLFSGGASACVPLTASQEALERAIMDAVDQREAHRAEEQAQVEQLRSTCSFARAYRHGYYCLKPGACVEGLSRAGWLAIEGKEFQKCPKRPLLVESLEGVGFAAWTGKIEAARSPELRKQLFLLIREGKRELVINCQGLLQAHYNLFEILADAADEMAKVTPVGVLHLMNVSPGLLEEFRKGANHKNVRFHGVRMLDEQSSFARWATRFD